MKVSELIKQLKVAKAQHGDVEVRFQFEQPDEVPDDSEEVGGVIAIGGDPGMPDVPIYLLICDLDTADSL